MVKIGEIKLPNCRYCNCEQVVEAVYRNPPQGTTYHIDGRHEPLCPMEIDNQINGYRDPDTLMYGLRIGIKLKEYKTK